MAVRYYDDAIREKLMRWIPSTSNLRVLKADETKRFFELTADDTNDAAFKLPLVTLSRNNDIEILTNIKSPRSYDGLKLFSSGDQTVHFNVIPIKVEYQLDIYTKTYEEGDEYIRNFLFKLINNPKIIIDIPYNNFDIHHVANLRVLSTVSDTSDISEHLFAGQFTKWTIQLELQDAFLFSIPYRRNWRFGGADLVVITGDSLTDNGAWDSSVEPIEYKDKTKQDIDTMNINEMTEVPIIKEQHLSNSISISNKIK